MRTQTTPAERRALRLRLEREALRACEWRGHEMGPFAASEWRPDSVSTAYCNFCGRGVTVNARPMPNEIDIGGEAVALNCEPLAAEARELLALTAEARAVGTLTQQARERLDDWIIGAHRRALGLED